VFCVSQFDCCDGLRRASQEEFFARTSPDQLTIVYVHGGRVTQEDAFARTRKLHRALTLYAGDEPLRMVCWSWPNAKTARVIKDFQEAATITDAHGYYLAWFVSQFPAGARVSLTGFSYGPRVITGALHVLGGGCLAGCRLPEGGACQPVRVVLWSAAVHNFWLAPDAHHGMGMHCVDRMLIVMNPCDPVLKRYHLIDKCSNPEALGYTGPACLGKMEEFAGQLDVVNASCALQNSHSADRHLGSPFVTGVSAPYLLWQPIDAEE
jgi:hypothetical protein